MVGSNPDLQDAWQTVCRKVTWDVKGRMLACSWEQFSGYGWGTTSSLTTGAKTELDLNGPVFFYKHRSCDHLARSDWPHHIHRCE